MSRRVRRAILAMSLAALAACPWDSTAPNPAAGLEKLGGDLQVAEVGTAVALPSIVKVVDGEGRGVEGVTVSWAASAGGTVSFPTSRTNDGGFATSPKWTLSTLAGTNQLTATVSSIDKSVSFTASGRSAAAASITVQAGANQTAAAGEEVAIAPAVRLTDAYGNPVRGAMITFTATAGGGTVSSPQILTNSTGVAKVGGWTLGPTGPNTLQASNGVLAAAVFSATATAPATHLAMHTEPSGVVSSVPFSTQPAVSIRDASNAVITTSIRAVTASIATGDGILTGTTTVNAVNGVATFTNLAVTGTAAVTLGFSSSGITAATSTAFTPAPPPPLNLTIDNVHLTQATQTYAGTVPLVAGRPALARVFVKANVTNLAAPAVQLRTYSGGALLRAYTIPAPATGVPTTIDEQTLTSSWNVRIPANEVVVGMTIVAEVDPANSVGEASDADNSFPASGALALDVRQVPTMKVTFVPVTQTGVVAGDIRPANQDAWLDYARRVYPFDTVDVVIAAPYAYNGKLSGTSYDASWTGLLSELGAKRKAEEPGSLDRYYYGVAHPGYTSGNTGFGSIGFPTAIGVDFTGNVQPSTNYFSMTLAHEWGHNFGRLHVNCGGPTQVDTQYPYGPASSIGANGYDIQYDVLYKKDSYVDFMSYCQPLWISDYTYKAALDWRLSHFAVAGESQRSLLIWGRVGPSGVVLEPAFEIDAPPQLPAPGPYTVQALDDAGQQLFAVSFASTPIAHAADQGTFAFAIPLSSATQPAALRVLRGTQELTRRTRLTTLGASGATTSAAPAASRLVAAPNSRARLEWDSRAYAGAMVRDPATGEVLAILRGGAGEIAAARDVDVLFSNGVTSVRRRLQITPR